jgi:hypothetical protein
LGLQCGKRTDKASAAARLCFEALRPSLLGFEEVPVFTPIGVEVR